MGLTLLAGAIAAAVLIPLLWPISVSLQVGFDSAVELLFRPQTVQVFVNSLLVTGAVTGASIAIGVPMAYLTVRTDVPFRRLLTVVLALPLVIPSYIGAFAFVSAFGPRGRLQSVLAPLGVESLPTIYGPHGTVLVLTLYTYPYVYITTRAGLKSLDTTLIDAARTLDHSRREAFKRVVIPQIKPAVFAGALLVALYAISDFGTPAIMRYDVFTRVIYVEFNSFGRDTAALLSLQLVVVTLIILAVESRIRSGTRAGTNVSGYASGDDPAVRLGTWRYPAFLGCALVAGLALIVPLVILSLWLLGGSSHVASSLAFKSAYIVNSVSVSTAAAIVATLAGVPIAYLAAQRRTRLATFFERATYVGYAVPGVVLGLSLVFLGARYGGTFYRQGILLFPLLIFAYVVRFLPQSVGSTHAALLQVDGSLTEAARTLGRTPTQTFREVTLPLVVPGLLGGAALVFLTTMKELPATLLLRPAGFDTLVTHVWRAEHSGHYGQAAIPALVLLFVSGLSMLVILAMEGYDVE
jgi:iron(III) transport system permease protein